MNATSTPEMAVDYICETVVCRFVVNWIMVPLLKFFFLFLVPFTIVVSIIYIVCSVTYIIFTLISSYFFVKEKNDYVLQV